MDQAFRDLAQFWDRYLSRFQAETPDAAMNRMPNVHNPRQCYITMNWSRYLSLYQLGLGARGIGFRDTAQDVMGVLAGAPEEGKALLRKLLQVQRSDGAAMHQFNPLTMEASAGDSQAIEDRPNYYGDDHLWVVLVTTAYLDETGGLAFLEEEIAYYDRDREGRPIESGTVLDHLERAIQFTRRDVGTHGLPTRSLSNRHLRLVYLAEAGPRIVRLFLAGTGKICWPSCPISVGRPPMGPTIPGEGIASGTPPRRTRAPTSPIKTAWRSNRWTAA